MTGDPTPFGRRVRKAVGSANRFDAAGNRSKPRRHASARGEAVVSIRQTLELGAIGSRQNAAAGHRAMTPRSAVPTAQTIPLKLKLDCPRDCAESSRAERQEGWNGTKS